MCRLRWGGVMLMRGGDRGLCGLGSFWRGISCLPLPPLPLHIRLILWRLIRILITLLLHNRCLSRPQCIDSERVLLPAHFEIRMKDLGAVRRFICVTPAVLEIEGGVLVDTDTRRCNVIITPLYCGRRDTKSVGFCRMRL